ncbi:MAG: DUF2993 domain-containing protein [Candidatus Dormibacteraeota bacterium]|nr:DUF2993 domain-containing protein [Candidatus Dormibacteraeota bacterium]
MRVLVAILVVIALLVAGLVVADRVAENLAANLIAQQVRTQLHLAQRPHVNIAGFPFLTQVASGDYQEIDLSIPSVTALAATVDDVAATARGVHARPFLGSAAGVRSASASRVDLSGRIPLSSIPLPPGFTATASGSKLRVSGSVSALGLSVPVTATEQIALNGSTISFRPTDIQARAGGSKLDVSGTAAKQLTVSVDLSGLPFHVRVTRLTVRPSGVGLEGRASNVSLAGA